MALDIDNTTTFNPTAPLKSDPDETTTTQKLTIQQFQTPPTYNQAAIDSLTSRTHYPITQENGQRKYGPSPLWTHLTEPDRSCEVFIGKIPRDCFEDELIPILEQIGLIYEFRLMMEYSGYNRGYGFVMYTTHTHAKQCVLTLNNYEIRKGRLIGVCRSVDNCRLFVGGIPKTKRKEEILAEMRKITDDVVNVIVYPSAHDKMKNRGFAFVQYTNHRAAAIARRKLIPARIQLFGQAIAVDWAEPEPEVDEDVMAQVKVLYVRNLMLTTSEETIKSEFEKAIGSDGGDAVERVKKMKDFAFVHFRDREVALKSIGIMNGKMIEEARIEVTLSKPIEKTTMAVAAARFGNPHLTQIGLSTSELNLLLGVGTTTTTDQIQQQLQLQQQLNNNTQGGSGLNLNIHHPLLAQNPMMPPPPPLNCINHHQIPIQSPTSILNPSDSYSLNSYLNPYLQTSPPIPPTSKNLYSPSQPRRPPMSWRQTNLNSSHYRSNYGIYNTNNYKGKKQLYNQILEEFCFKEGLAPPVYTLHTTRGQDQDGKELCLFMYKIMIAGLFNNLHVSSQKLVTTLDEAKNDAAEFYLTQLFPQTQSYLNLGSIPYQNNMSLTLPPPPPPANISSDFGGAANVNGLIQPQFIFDPTGQYLIGWQ